ncbi:MAG: transposase [Marinobacterium sp.]|nr:transposase [Marinobacterium sp.]
MDRVGFTAKLKQLNFPFRLHPELVQPAYIKNALWSPSYYAGNVGGASVSVIRQYIEQQTRPD